MRFQAGLNLNLVGAVSGLFLSKSSKETGTDGQVIERKDEQAAIKGESLALFCVVLA